jgi:hypothetical protein
VIHWIAVRKSVHEHSRAPFWFGIADSRYIKKFCVFVNAVRPTGRGFADVFTGFLNLLFIEHLKNLTRSSAIDLNPVMATQALPGGK